MTREELKHLVELNGLVDAFDMMVENVNDDALENITVESINTTFAIDGFGAKAVYEQILKYADSVRAKLDAELARWWEVEPEIMFGELSDRASIVARLKDLAREAKSHFTDDGNDDVLRADYNAQMKAAYLIEKWLVAEGGDVMEDVRRGGCEWID